MQITDQANANAQLIRLNATAQVEQIRFLFGFLFTRALMCSVYCSQRQQAFKAAKASLEFTNDDLLQLIWLNTVRGLSTDSDLAVDLDSAFLQL